MNEITFKLDQRQLMLEIPRQMSGDFLEPDLLEQAFLRSEYKDCLIEPDVWVYVPRRFTIEKSKENTPFVSLQVGEQRPAQLTLRISDDKMEAEAVIEAPYGGSSIVTEQVLSQLRNINIINGIRKRAIEAIVAHSREAPPGASLTLVIAKGKLAEDGADASFKRLVEDARKRLLQPQAKDKHRVDMRDFGLLISVKAGTPVLQKVPFTEGMPGYTVTGEKLEAKSGKDTPLKPGTGTEVSPDNPNLLVATVDGLPSFTGNSANVDNVLTLTKVDVSTGHVNYDGSVIIGGNVAPGMKVTASGDITVNGYVDSATLRATGNITVTKGVIGRQIEIDEDADPTQTIEHSTRLIADATIWVAYSQYATLIAKQGIFADKQLTHCTLITPGETHIGGQGQAAMGKLIGGHIEIADNLFVGQLGAPAGTRTRIYFDLPLQSEEQQDAEEQAAQELKRLVLIKRKLLKARDTYLANPTAYKPGFKQSLKNSFSGLQKKITQAREKLLYLRANEVYPLPPVRVHINKVMHAGAEFMYHDKIKRFDESRGPCTILLSEGQIKVES